VKYSPLYLIAIFLLLSCSQKVEKPDALIAVATNFVETAKTIETDFEAATDYDITLTTSATGQLYAQIVNGAPFDAFLAADQARPQALEQGGQAVIGSRFTYALGAIALWSPTLNPVNAQTLEKKDFRRLAIANPDLAPYGRAAKQYLEFENLYESLSPKIVMGENIGQTYGLVATENAELGIVALSAMTGPDPVKGIYWLPAKESYDPIRQDAVLLTRAKDNDAAKAFLAYLKSDAASAIITANGFAP